MALYRTSASAGAGLGVLAAKSRDHVALSDWDGAGWSHNATMKVPRPIAALSQAAMVNAKSGNLLPVAFGLSIALLTPQSAGSQNDVRV